MSALQRPVSLKDIAERAEVSVSTASRALSNLGAISAEVRRRVRGVADELGYERRGAVRLGAVRVFTTLDTLANDAAGFYADIIDGIADALTPFGVVPEIVGLDSGRDLAAAVTAQHSAAASDGIMLLALDAPELLAASLATGAACVLVNGTDPAMAMDSVAPANAAGSALAMQHLIALGHRQIVHIGAGHRRTIADRWHGVQTAMAAAGLRLPDGARIDLPHLLPDLGHAAIASRLDTGARPTAIVCGNDLVAVGVLRALQERGISVPQDCSVIGFDDVPIAALASPPLTTVAVDRRGLGRAAVRLLTDRAASPAAAQVTLQLGCRLVLRGTTAPAPRSRT